MRDINELIKSNNECMEKIDEKYWELRDLIVSYIRVKLAEEESEEAINDILDIFLEAQNRGEDLNKVVGQDYVSFSDEFIKAYKYKEKFYFMKKIKRPFLKIMKYLIFILAILVIAKAPYDSSSISEFASKSYDVTLDFIIAIIGITLYVYALNFTDRAFSSINMKLRKKTGVFFSAFLLIIMWQVFIILINKLEHYTIISIKNYLICYILSVLTLIYYVVKFVKYIFNYRKRYLEYIGGYRENEK